MTKKESYQHLCVRKQAERDLLHRAMLRVMLERKFDDRKMRQRAFMETAWWIFGGLLASLILIFMMYGVFQLLALIIITPLALFGITTTLVFLSVVNLINRLWTR